MWSLNEAHAEGTKVMFGIIVRMLTAAGPVIYKIPGAGAAAQRIAAQLVKNGGKIIKPPKGGFKGPTKAGTPANVAKAIKDLKKSNTGAGRPVAKKPVAKKPTAKPTTAKPNPGAAKKGGLKTKKRTIPKDAKVNKIPKNAKPFKPKTQKQKDAQKKREETQKQNMKNENRRNPGRDPKGKFDKKPVTSSNVPRTGGAKKGGLKSRLDAKAKRAAMGLGVAAVKADNLSRGEIEIGPRQNTKVTPKTGQGRPSAIPKNRKKTSGVRPNLDKNTNTKKEMTFGEKFDEARRKKKEPTFTFKGKKYTTRLKEESIADHKKKFGVTGKY